MSQLGPDGQAEAAPGWVTLLLRCPKGPDNWSKSFPKRAVAAAQAARKTPTEEMVPVARQNGIDAPEHAQEPCPSSSSP